MYVDLAQLEHDELCVEHEYAAGELELEDTEIALCAPPRVRFRLQRLGLEIRIEGRIEAEVEAQCDRCLRAFRFTVTPDFDVLYAPLAVLTPEEEVQLTERDLRFGFYQNELIDIDALVREQIRLALPFRLLCRENCRGLCPQCGADLNHEVCRCAPPVDVRWAALWELKRRMEDS
ncbi:MAG: DUF177 domain-containing protein [Blastocatellia bacterium]|nr:DUF177 domain-containing protein [Blastocatellia bacterium]MCS7157659.1 DUF177 domain-containing protein [Blastocatellia bacterium]MCX7751924.1 DUF177 domain-containing protein [Blastocatellia bacterium]MDW8167030.1 DUF177 domain-containing protein [Acidobacteriota bacterium]MDW8257134.1 DUF177 domain-containing protein [Acidobacteriota bacterium]